MHVSFNRNKIQQVQPFTIGLMKQVTIPDIKGKLKSNKT